MALSKFHTLAFLIAANRNGFDKDCIQSALPYVLLPDAIRCFALARPITHFEIGDNGVASGIRFPEDDLKSITEESDLKALCETDGIYHQVGIGDTTSLEKFDEMNREYMSFWAYTFIRLHLQQDMIYDAYIRKVIDCSHRFESGNPFYFNGKTYDAVSVRTLIAEIEEQEFRALSKIYEDETKTLDESGKEVTPGTVVTQAWFDEEVKPIIEKAYGKTMAAKTLSYIHIDNESEKAIHLTTEEQLKGMKEMIDDIIKVSENAITSMG